jgi:hypothetical protein
MTLRPFEGRVERKTVHRCERAESRRLIWRWLTSVNGAFTIVNRSGVVLRYSEMYHHLKRCPKSPMLDLELAKLIQWFLETAEKTFANRRERQRIFLKWKREQERQERERAKKLSWFGDGGLFV